MAAGSVQLELKGSLKSRPASCNGVASTSSGPTFQLALKTANMAAAQEESSTVRAIDSAALFVDLGLPANQASRVFYIRVQTLTPLTIRLTTETTGLVVLPSVAGTYLQEFATDDRLTLVEIQGQGTVEWYAAGDVV